MPGLIGIALAPTLPGFYAGWVLVGLAMAGTLYPPAFAALTRWGRHRRLRALTTVTLIAGLASTVFAPLASLLDDRVGWHLAYLLLLGAQRPPGCGRRAAGPGRTLVQATAVTDRWGPAALLMAWSAPPPREAAGDVDIDLCQH